MRKIKIFILVSLFLGFFLSGQSFSQVILYDDFSEPGINKDKWRQGEYVREINMGDHKLHLKTETPNPIMMTTFPYNVRNRVSFVNPNSINSIQAEVTVVESSIVGGGRNYAYIGGRFYNDGTPGGGYAGDIWAEVDIRETNSGLQAMWYIGRYPTSSGTSISDVALGFFTTPIIQGTPYTLSIEYDQANHKFIFKVGNEAVPYGPAGLPSRASDASMPWKALMTVSRAYNASESASLWATFDNVYINGMFYDDFSIGDIDEAKWSTYEFVREISEGKFRSMVVSNEGYTYVVTSELSMVNPASVNAIQAKVTPLDYLNLYGIRVGAHVFGGFYNDGTPGEGRIGDVGATVLIGGRDETPVAAWAVFRYGDAAGNVIETIDSGIFATPITLGNTYTHFVGWDGTKIIMRFEGEEATYTPATSIHPIRVPFKGISTRITPEPGKVLGIIEALFDDVMVGVPEKIGVFRDGNWYLDANGNGGWDGCSIERCYTFGLSTDTPLVGDWSGGGTKKIGVRRGSNWYHDYNGNGRWDGCSVDRCYSFGLSTDIPVVGDWNGDGRDEIGVFRGGSWYLDYNGNGVWDGCSVDLCISFGLGTDIPVVGDWNGDGYTEIGVVRNGVWYLDYDRSDSWSGCSVDRCYSFGLSTDIPVVGDWSGDGVSKIGVRRGASWYLDYDGNGVWNWSVDKAYPLFGLSTDKPLCGNW